MTFVVESNIIYGIYGENRLFLDGFVLVLQRGFEPRLLPRFARKSFYFNIYRLAAKAATVDFAFVSGVLDRQNSSKRDGLMTVSFLVLQRGFEPRLFAALCAEKLLF